jgi:hypothetical protein
MIKDRALFRERVIACRVTQDEIEKIAEIADGAGFKDVAKFARAAVLEKMERCAGHRWEREWSAMEQMDGTDAIARFRELQNGRQLPKGFKDWDRSRKIDWLNQEWTL